MIKKIIYIAILGIVFCFGEGNLLAQRDYQANVKTETPIQEQYLYAEDVDSLLNSDYQTVNTVYPQKFKNKFQDKYTSEAFNYNTIKPQKSIWQIWMDKLGEFLDNLFKSSHIDGINNFTLWIFRIFSILLVGVVLYFLIRFLLQKNGNWIFTKKGIGIDPETEDITENIHVINFPTLIGKYEQLEDYRTAVRYWFLYVLKSMTDKDLIEWDPEKTNRDYMQLLLGSKYHRDFQELARIFDYIWYGKREINQADYVNYKSKYQRVLHNL
ncbi:MAG: DUF4129 domain-containing protein [Brumimicrobium sp.]|nr:DUF4129 domain-containing protein [Brumimicrobium sp.]MCO5269165.1 DUF4129 domain-containing protein [Brumimicrobium sp.]